MQLNDHQYYALRQFIEASCRRVQNSQCSVGEATSDIMRTLSLWDKDEKADFEAAMQMKLDQWSTE